MEPTKKVTPMAGREADAHCDATLATAKHAAPIAKPRAIHELVLRRLRCRREDQRTRPPSGRRKVSCVTNGPGPSLETRSPPGGSSTYPCEVIDGERVA